MNLQINIFLHIDLHHLRSNVVRGYHEAMYKNTVPRDEGEPLTQARVRKPGETNAQLRMQARECARQGVKVMVFSDQATLEAWRVRVAALA